MQRGRTGGSGFGAKLAQIENSLGRGIGAFVMHKVEGRAILNRPSTRVRRPHFVDAINMSRCDLRASL